MLALEQLITEFIAFVPNLLGAIVVLLIGWLVLRVTSNLLRRLLVALGIDRLGERLQRIDIIAKSDTEIHLSTLFSKLFYYVLMLFVLVAASDVLGMEIVSTLVATAIAYIPNLIAALVILIVGILLADALREIVVITCRSFGIRAADLIASIAFWFVVITVLVSALSQAQLETNFVIASISILLAGFALAFAIAYGLAAKSLMGGFLAMFYNRGKINPGDRVRIGEYTGLIVAIDRASFSLDVDGQTLIVPLAKLQTEEVLIVERAAGADKYIA